MQKPIMPPPHSPTSSSHSNKTAHLPEPENPFESKESKPHEEPAQKSDETAAGTVGRSDSPEVVEEEEEDGVCSATVATKSEGAVEDSGRERLKRHRVEVAGRVWIPDMWGQEDLLKDWIDCAAFDASLVNSSIVLARDALMGERRRANSTTLRIHNGC